MYYNYYKNFHNIIFIFLKFYKNKKFYGYFGNFHGYFRNFYGNYGNFDQIVKESAEKF